MAIRSYRHSPILLMHWAINGWKPSRFRNNQAYALREIAHPIGQATVDQRGVKVRCLEPDHPFVVSSTCRIERDNYHNRIHHPRARYLAEYKGEVPEICILECGGRLHNPLFADEPVRHCECGKGDALMCPRCALARHGSDVFTSGSPCSAAHE